MAVGDATVGLSSIASASYLTIQPGAGVEWIIHNLYYPDAVEIYLSDGTNEIKFDFDISAGGRLGYVFHVTNTHYLRVKNVSGATMYIGYDGVVTK